MSLLLHFLLDLLSPAGDFFLVRRKLFPTLPMGVRQISAHVNPPNLMVARPYLFYRYGSVLYESPLRAKQ